MIMLAIQSYIAKYHCVYTQGAKVFQTFRQKLLKKVEHLLGALKTFRLEFLV